MGYSKERIPISNKERNNKSSVKNNFQQTELLNPTYKGVMAKRWVKPTTSVQMKKITKKPTKDLAKRKGSENMKK